MKLGFPFHAKTVLLLKCFEMSFMKEKVYIAGHAGMVGNALKAKLSKNPRNQVITTKRTELDLRRQSDVEQFFEQTKPNVVYLAAAKVGGIKANNSYPVDFLYDNIMIQSNVINACFKHGIKNLLFLGSSCIYPKYAEQPIEENELLNGYLEPTNEPYAIAKISGVKLCESYNRQYGKSLGIDYRAVMPTNLYGPNDNFTSEADSHVIPGLLQRFHRAKVNKEQAVSIWGTGRAKREFLHVDDLADACMHIMSLSAEEMPKNASGVQTHINIGSGEEVTIFELAHLISKIVGFEGEILFDPEMPDGTPRKLLDCSRLRELGWKHSIPLNEGLSATYDFMLASEL